MPSVGSRRRKPMMVRAPSPTNKVSTAAYIKAAPPAIKPQRPRPFRDVECEWIPSTENAQDDESSKPTVEEAIQRGQCRAELGLSHGDEARDPPEVKGPATAAHLDAEAAMRRGQFKAELLEGPQLGEPPPCPPTPPFGGSAHEVATALRCLMKHSHYCNLPQAALVRGQARARRQSVTDGAEFTPPAQDLLAESPTVTPTVEAPETSYERECGGNADKIDAAVARGQEKVRSRDPSDSRTSLAPPEPTLSGTPVPPRARNRNEALLMALHRGQIKATLVPMCTCKGFV